jgi:hypothetical protein
LVKRRHPLGVLRISIQIHPVRTCAFAVSLIVTTRPAGLAGHTFP